MQKEVKKSNTRNSINQENIFIPSTLTGNYIKIAESIIDDLFNLDEKKKKYAISTYLYMKIKLNESYSGYIKTSMREIANAFNTNVRNIHDAINQLKALHTIDIKINTSKSFTTVSNNKDAACNNSYIPFSKELLKKVFTHGISSTAIYSFIYTNIHKSVSFSKGEYTGIQVQIKELSGILSTYKGVINKELNELVSSNFINKITKRKLGNLITLRDDNINQEHINQDKKISLYSKHLKINKSVYETLDKKISLYSKHRPADISFQEVDTKETKKPLFKKTFLKKPKEEEEVFLNSKEEVQEDSNSDKIDKIEKKIRHLEKLRIKFLSKLHYDPDLTGFTMLKSKYYDDKFEVYRLYYKENKIYVLYGDSMIDMDNYINYTRMNYKENHPTYVKSPKYWKPAFIRDFDKRKKIHEKSNYELRILKYIQYIRRTAEEDIVNKIKSLERSISKLSPMNNIINNSNRKEKDNNQSNLDIIKEFKKEHPDIFYKIDEEVTNSIKMHKLNVTPEYLMTLLINRINAYKNGNPV